MATRASLLKRRLVFECTRSKAPGCCVEFLRAGDLLYSDYARAMTARSRQFRFSYILALIHQSNEVYKGEFVFREFLIAIPL